ncbi:hypothetical protein BSM4216_3265 [Bacillus smithii]|nr:hypothetical protein BSM4216_3265 [Bacillus smithii]
MAGLPFKQNKNCFPEKGKQCMNERICFPLPMQAGSVSRFEVFFMRPFQYFR